jgi:protein involved in polysaccharide export with SLBB domain
LKGTIAMIATLGIALAGIFLAQTTEPPDIAGQWTGEDWGQVVRKKTNATEYTGTYTDTVGKQPGEIELKWSRIERRFNGTWREGEDRFGELSVRSVGDEIHGALTTDPKSKINPATPRLADLRWTRAKTPQAPSEKTKVSLPAYRIEPPDILQIEILNQVPLPSPVTGQYLVGPDGTINLRRYGVVHVAGKTIMEARIAIRDHLKKFLASPELSVDVVGYNSKVYYIITQGPGMGDNVRRVPITGNETVLDAICQIDGLDFSRTKIWIARPAPHNFGRQQILPVDFEAITQRGQTETNFQILPGDRVFIKMTPAKASATGQSRFSPQRARKPELPPDLQELPRAAEMQTIVLAALEYATEHPEWPKTLDELKPKYVDGGKIDLGQFVYHPMNRESMEKNPQDVALLSEKDPATAGGQFVGFADGYVEFIRDPERLKRLFPAERVP